MPNFDHDWRYSGSPDGARKTLTEERLRAVELYLKSGRRVKATIRELGYLSPMIDCFDGMVVSWSIGTSPDAELVNTMLDAAIETVTQSDGKPIVHSDRGGHYRWPGWLSRVADAKLTRSMSRKACSPDNATCEGFFGRLKTEMFYPWDWRSTTIAQFVEALDGYVRWYNEKRIKRSLGYLSPIEYRESLGLTT